MALQSCSSSFTYDVFLSFSGKNTRYGFTGNLYKALDDKGIHTFFDEEELRSGEVITEALETAIKKSRIAITVLSKDYAYSSFCLEELATIIDCNSKGLLIIPVFYEVEPSDVRYQKNSYREAFVKHEERFKHNPEKVHKWKQALCQVANFSGYHFKDIRDECEYQYEYKFIERIVERVSWEINHAPLHVADYPVGLETQVFEVKKLLNVRSDDDGVHMIGIHGMGGIGKSTLAREVYNKLIAGNMGEKSKFDGECFLENVREKSKKSGLESLQKILLLELLGEGINLTSCQQGISMIKHRLQGKKVLLILDDVNMHEQLQALAGRPDWFGRGSIIIITTRNKQLLASHQVKGYEVNGLNENDALQLLTWKAFKKEKADPTYVEVLNSVLNYASGLPLALEVIGSNLFGKNVDEWKSAIDQYKLIPNNQIQDILKVSFDALHDQEKSVFLDIACCLKGLTGVEDKLRAHYGHCMKYPIGVLVEKSLLKLSHNMLTMHDLIEDMGKEIVRQELPDEPGKRSRLWSQEDIIEVLEENTGTTEIKMICLEFSKFSEMVEWSGNGFKEMRNLKTLIMKNSNFSEGPKYLPNSLRVLEWWGYPSQWLPSDFRPKKLAICLLPYSSIMSFKLNGLSKKFEDLTVLNFDECKCLTEIPDVSGFPNLEELSFKHCDNLVTVHESVGFLDKLKSLSAFGSKKLRSFPPIKLTSLESLQLSCCESLENFPEILGKMENIKLLELRGTSIKELPLSIINFVGLQLLIVYDCGGKFLSRFLMMPQLTEISVKNLEGWQWLKEGKDEEKVNSIVFSKVKRLMASQCNLNDDFFSIGFQQLTHLEYLDLSGNNFTFFPECIKEFQSLRSLHVTDCKHLQEIRGVPPNIENFNARNCKSLTSLTASMFINQELYEAGMTQCHLPGVWIPEWFDHHQSRGPSTSFWFRNKLPNRILCLLIAPVQWPYPAVIINGKKVHNILIFGTNIKTDMDHTHLLELYERINLSEVTLGKEWNHLEVTYAGEIETSVIKAMGIHVFNKEKEDIRFTDPCRKRKLDDYLNSLQSDNNRLLKKCRFVDMDVS